MKKALAVLEPTVSCANQIWIAILDIVKKTVAVAMLGHVLLMKIDATMVPCAKKKQIVNLVIVQNQVVVAILGNAIIEK